MLCFCHTIHVCPQTAKTFSRQAAKTQRKANEKEQLTFILEEIGVELTEGMMMEPEASVMVFHHPDCAYFTAVETDAVAV